MSLSERADCAKQAPRAQENARLTPVPSEGETSASQQLQLWCNQPLDELLPTEPFVWPYKDEDEKANGCQLHRVSATVEVLLTEGFTKLTARLWCKTFGMLATEVTKCPRLDNTLKVPIFKDGKDADWPLSCPNTATRHCGVTDEHPRTATSQMPHHWGTQVFQKHWNMEI